MCCYDLLIVLICITLCAPKYGLACLLLAIDYCCWCLLFTVGGLFVVVDVAVCAVCCLFRALFTGLILLFVFGFDCLRLAGGLCKGCGCAILFVCFVDLAVFWCFVV